LKKAENIASPPKNNYWRYLGDLIAEPAISITWQSVVNACFLIFSHVFVCSNYVFKFSLFFCTIFSKNMLIFSVNHI